MGEMDISERRIPQDGGFRAQFNKDMMIDLRVNTLPGIHGEKMVLRIISKAELRSTVSELGFSRLLEIVITKETHFQIIEREGEIVGRKIKFILDKGQEWRAFILCPFVCRLSEEPEKLWETIWYPRRPR